MSNHRERIETREEWDRDSRATVPRACDSLRGWRNVLILCLSDFAAKTGGCRVYRNRCQQPRQTRCQLHTVLHGSVTSPFGTECYEHQFACFRFGLSWQVGTVTGQIKHDVWQLQNVAPTSRHWRDAWTSKLHFWRDVDATGLRGVTSNVALNLPTKAKRRMSIEAQWRVPAKCSADVTRARST